MGGGAAGGMACLCPSGSSCVLCGIFYPQMMVEICKRALCKCLKPASAYMKIFKV